MDPVTKYQIKEELKNNFKSKDRKNFIYLPLFFMLLPVLYLLMIRDPNNDIKTLNIATASSIVLNFIFYFLPYLLLDINNIIHYIAITFSLYYIFLFITFIISVINSNYKNVKVSEAKKRSLRINSILNK